MKAQTAKEKAEEVYQLMRVRNKRNLVYLSASDAKECAIIAVDLILTNDACDLKNKPTDANTLICEPDYWQQVKAELEIK